MSSKSIIPTTVNPDLEKERQSATLNSEDFAIWWHGGEKELQFKREFENFMFKDFDENGSMMQYLSHEDIYEKSIKLAIECSKKLRKFQELKNPGGTDIWPGKFSSPPSWAIMPLGNPSDVHFTLVLEAIKSQGTDEQYEKFGKRAANYEICSAYAQTELGHGTFIRGLETRADYDRSTQEFILNSPTISAYKFWPGGLGHTTSYALVVAQLYIDNESKGVEMFWVPVRDEETHMPLPGIDIGDIGKKMGFHAVNNGFLGFKNVRVPRDHMLMRYDQVSADGTFVKGKASVLTYFALVWGRVGVARNIHTILAGASTITTRYSAVRRQSPINPEESEVQILDHVTQQYKVFPEIATTVAFKVASRYLDKILIETEKNIKSGDISRLPELHALSCVLKAMVSYDVTAGVERLRLSCGGHGYLVSSNLPFFYAGATASCTYEGENTVLLLQAGRFLMKAWKNALEGKPLAPTVSFLSDVIAYPEFGKWSRSCENIVKVMQYAAARKIRLAFGNFAKRLQRGQTEGEAANNTGIELIQAAELYGRSFICSTFLNEIRDPQSSINSISLRQNLNNLLELYLVNTAFKNLSDIIQVVTLTDEDTSNLQFWLENLLKVIRPNAVAICDGFDLHDVTLNSTLGSYDGNAYERIFEAAKKSPLNKNPVPKVFIEHLKPYMKSKL